MPTRRHPLQDASEPDGGERAPTPLTFPPQSVAEQAGSEHPYERRLAGTDPVPARGEFAEASTDCWTDPNVEQFLRISAQVLRRRQANNSKNGGEDE